MKTKKRTKLYEWQRRCADGGGAVCAKCDFCKHCKQECYHFKKPQQKIEMQYYIVNNSGHEVKNIDITKTLRVIINWINDQSK